MMKEIFVILLPKIFLLFLFIKKKGDFLQIYKSDNFNMEIIFPSQLLLSKFLI